MDDEERKLRDYYEVVTSFQGKALDQSATYNNVIILAGYAAFFAVWSAIAEEIPRWAMLTCGGLIIVSVTVYVAWTVANMIFLKTSQEAMAQALSQGFDGFVTRVTKVEADNLRRRGPIMKWWLPVVSTAGASALVAALLLAVSALASVFETGPEDPPSVRMLEPSTKSVLTSPQEGP